MYHICFVYIYPLNGYRELNSFEEPCFTLVATITSFARELKPTGVREHIFCHPQTDCFVIHRRTVSFHPNSSVWRERLDSRSWDRNLTDWNTNPRFYHSSRRKPYIYECVWVCMYVCLYKSIYLSIYLSIKAWAVECIDCIFAEGCLPNKCPTCDIKQSDGKAPLMLELWRIRCSPLLLRSQVHFGPVW